MTKKILLSTLIFLSLGVSLLSTIIMTSDIEDHSFFEFSQSYNNSQGDNSKLASKNSISTEIESDKQDKVIREDEIAEKNSVSQPNNQPIVQSDIENEAENTESDESIPSEDENSNNEMLPIHCDLNCDGVVDFKDTHLINAFWEHVYPCFSNTPDLNSDDIVSQADLGIILSAFGTENDTIDLNSDHVINDQDIFVIKGFWGLDPCVDSYPYLNLDLTGDNIIDQSDLGLLLANVT